MLYYVMLCLVLFGVGFLQESYVLRNYQISNTYIGLISKTRYYNAHIIQLMVERTFYSKSMFLKMYLS